MADAASGNAVVVRLALCAAESDAAVLGALTASDRSWIARLLRPEDRAHTTVSRALVRHGLAPAMKDKPSQLSAVPVGRTDSRKPFLAGPRAPGMEAFNVNASHHGGIVGCASCDHALAGFDVMRFERRPGVSSDEAFFAIMTDYFTAAEFTAIRAGVEPRAVEASVAGAGRPAPACSPQLRSFYWHWVSKEAFVKCMGLGIVVPLGRIRVRFDGPPLGETAVLAEGGRVTAEVPAGLAATVVEVDGEPVAGWKAVPLLINGAFPAAVAAASLEAAAAPLADDGVWPCRPAPEASSAESTGGRPGSDPGASLGLASSWPPVELIRVVVEAPVLGPSLA